MGYTDAQIKELVAKLFQKYDVDKNGVLDKKELMKFISEAYAQMGGKESNSGEVNQILKKYDKNEDQFIDQAELHLLIKDIIQQ